MLKQRVLMYATELGDNSGSSSVFLNDKKLHFNKNRGLKADDIEREFGNLAGVGGGGGSNSSASGERSAHPYNSGGPGRGLGGRGAGRGGETGGRGGRGGRTLKLF